MTPDQPSNDQLHRFSFENLPVRGQWVRLTDSLSAANSHRTYPPAVKNLLSQMFAAVAMFADNLKFEGAVTLQSKGDGGPLIRSLAECRDQKYLRGIAHLEEQFQAPPDPHNLAAWLGKGHLALSLIPHLTAKRPPIKAWSS